MRNRDLKVRKAASDDRDFILSLVPRHVKFGPPPWRHPAQMIEAVERELASVLSDPPIGSEIFVAEDTEC